MKNIFKFCFLFFAMTAVMTSCNNDDDDSDPNNPNTNQSGISLVSPQNNAAYTASNGDVTVDFDWSDVSGATGYTFQISDSNSFDNVSTETTTTSQLSAPIVNASTETKTYYWRVSVEGQSEWSTVYTLVIQPEGGGSGGNGFTMGAPADNAEFELDASYNADVNFQWTDNETSDAYVLQIAQYGSFVTYDEYLIGAGASSYSATVQHAFPSPKEFFWRLGTYPVGGNPEDVVWKADGSIIVNPEGWIPLQLEGTYSGNFASLSDPIGNGEFQPIRIENMTFIKQSNDPNYTYYDGQGTVILMDTFGVEHSGYIYMDGNFDPETNEYYYDFNSLQSPEAGHSFGSNVSPGLVQFSEDQNSSDGFSMYVNTSGIDAAYCYFQGFDKD